jgi:hypothetical protein
MNNESEWKDAESPRLSVWLRLCPECTKRLEYDHRFREDAEEEAVFQTPVDAVEPAVFECTRAGTRGTPPCDGEIRLVRTSSFDPSNPGHWDHEVRWP